MLISPAEPALQRYALAAHTLVDATGWGGVEDGGRSGTAFDHLRPVVRDSWRRSLNFLKPGAIEPVLTFESAELRDYRRDHPLAAVRPVINRLLVEPAQDTGLVVAIGDAGGRLLWVEGDRAALTSAESVAFIPGADWSERSVGTSAPGTALATGAGVQVSGAEHYSRIAHRVSCTAVPIHGPDGKVLGVIDLTGGDDAVASHSLSLVQAAVAAAEAELKLAAYDAAGRPAPRSPRRSAPPSPTAGAAAGAAAGFERGAGRSSGHAAPTAQLTLSALGRDGVELTIVHGSTVDEVTAASKPNTTDQPATAGQPSSVRLTGRHAEILTLLAWHQGAATFGRSVAASGWSAARPTAAAGLSADALAVALLGEDARPVTLRAEVSRLRHALAASGAGIALESRPYRLEPTPVCDARRVLELIGRGRYRAALELYRGPILPASTAPGIEAIRAEVSGALREAMLSDAGPEVLMTYLALPEAHDDVAAWRTALAVLPPRSPRRAVVVSHLETLEA